MTRKEGARALSERCQATSTVISTRASLKAWHFRDRDDLSGDITLITSVFTYNHRECNHYAVSVIACLGRVEVIISCGLSNPIF